MIYDSCKYLPLRKFSQKKPQLKKAVNELSRTASPPKKVPLKFRKVNFFHNVPPFGKWALTNGGLTIGQVSLFEKKLGL